MATDHRYLAMLADRQGFKIRETDLEQSPQDRHKGIYGRANICAVIDILRCLPGALHKRPLRFFGMVV